MTNDAQTRAVYDERAAEYAHMVADEDDRLALERFFANLPDGGRVLDFGCGPGHHARQMIDKGLQVDAWDGSSEMVAQTLAAHGIVARIAGFDDLNAESYYDGIWASFSLLHATKTDFQRHLEACRRALKSSGILYLGMKTGTGEKRDSIGRFYSYYTPSELEGCLTDAGFAPSHQQSGYGKGLDGSEAPYIKIFARA